MDVTITARRTATRTVYDIITRQYPRDIWIAQYLLGLSDHDKRDLAFALARETAMSRRCTKTRGEHTCSLDPAHAEDHECRACPHTWELDSAQPHGRT